MKISPVDRMAKALRLGVLPTLAELQSDMVAYGPYGGEMRLDYAKLYGYGIPCHETVLILLRSGPLLELGAGNGFWSYWIRRYGGDVIATDPGLKCPYGEWPWTKDIVRMEAISAMRAFPDRRVLIVWPEPRSHWATEALGKLDCGQGLFYVGQPLGGCCAPDEFFLRLRREGFRVLLWHPCPSWLWIPDFFMACSKPRITGGGALR
jgi:hypothetical protein